MTKEDIPLNNVKPSSDKRLFAVFDGGGDEAMTGLCLQLLWEQKRTWQEMQKAYESLTRVKKRTLRCGDFTVHLLFNPGRKVNTLADVGEQEINNRPCFLCPSNLPPEQKGILYRGNYLILCNPRPVFPAHFTIPSTDHIPQSFSGHTASFLRLMSDLGPRWSVLYNGPRCGASAPDHLHFQTVPSGFMPIEREITGEGRLVPTGDHLGARLFRARGLGREVSVVEGEHRQAVEEALETCLGSLQATAGPQEEPMVNIVGTFDGQRFRLLLFPRKKHRPAAFFRQGEGRVVVSPAVMEMAGIIVTPREEDFMTLDAPAVEAIYREVSLARPPDDE